MDIDFKSLEKLRAKFPSHQISKLPKPYKKDSPKGNCSECGGYHGLPAMHLDFVGHAALTDRLLDVDLNWTWEPLAFAANGLPLFDASGGLWIKLTILGVTRLGYGNAETKSYQEVGAREKEVIGDALRNAAMRFGAALDLWHKGDLHGDDEETPKIDHLTVLREAALLGTEALKNAVNKLPNSPEVDALWKENSKSLRLAAKTADDAKTPIEKVRDMADDIPY